MSDVADLKSEVDVAAYLFRAGVRVDMKQACYVMLEGVTPRHYFNHMDLLTVVSRIRKEGIVVPQALRLLNQDTIQGTIVALQSEES